MSAKKKPSAGLRRTTRATRRPVTERERNIELERIARKSERPNTPEPANANARGVVKRAGRKFKDGRETYSGELRRLAVYIPLELFDELKARAQRADKNYSQVTAEVFAEAFGVALEAAG